VTMQTVGKWRQAMSPALGSAADRRRCRRQVLTWTWKAPARRHTRSTRSMAKRCGLSQSAVSRIWRALLCSRIVPKTFQLSKDPLFIEKVRDIVGLY